MKSRLMLAGLGSILLPAGGAAGFTFTTAVSELPGGIPITGFSEYTIGNGGQIAAIATDAAFNDYLIYQPGDAATPTATIVAPATTNWNQLTLTGPAGAPQFTFVDNDNIYRHQAGTLHTLHAGQIDWGKFESINAAGQVLVSVDQFEWGNRGFHIREIVGNAVVGSGPYAPAYQAASGAVQHQSITPAGDIRFIDGSSPHLIHSPATFAGNLTPWVGTETINGNAVHPIHLMGATDNTILFTGAPGDAGDSYGVYLRSGTYENPTYHELFTSTDSISTKGMLSPGGRAVVAMDDQSLVYWDGATRYDLPADDPAIAGLSFIQRPMISDGADLVLFSAFSNSTAREGLYAWQPGGGVMAIIEGISGVDFTPFMTTIDGVEESVLFVNFPGTVGYYSDLISDDGHVVVSVTLGDDVFDSNSYTTRLITVVIPEPSLVGLAGLLAMPLLGRRRRA